MNRRHFMGPSAFRQRPRWGLLRAFPQGSMRTIATPWGRIEAWNSAPLSGPHDPLLWGGSLSSSPILLARRWRGRLAVDNRRRMREIVE